VGDEVGQRDVAHGEADADAAEETEASADEGDDGGLGEELAADVYGGGAEGFTDADFAGALGDGDEHDVHDSDAAKSEGEESDGSEEESHDVEDTVGELCAFEGIPDPEGVEVDGVEVVAVAEDGADLADGSFVDVGIDGLDDDVVKLADDVALGVGWEVALHGREGDEELAVVGAGAVAAVLLLTGEDADDGIGVASDADGLSDDGFSGKELGVGLVAENDDAGTVGFVLLGHEAALLDGEGPEVLVLGPGSADGAVGGVPLADLVDGADDLRRDVFDERGKLLDGLGVFDLEGDVAACGVASEGHAGFAAEQDGDVGADGLHLLLLVDAEADAEADEKDDGGDAPNDAEHGEKAAQFGVPKGGERLSEDFAERHGRRSLCSG